MIVECTNDDPGDGSYEWTIMESTMDDPMTNGSYGCVIMDAVINDCGFCDQRSYDHRSYECTILDITTGVDSSLSFTSITSFHSDT